jgi:hypothetical protein
MPRWVIKIVPAVQPTPEVPAAFVPDFIGAQPGQPLEGPQVDDIITWNNETGEDHWPWPVDDNGNPLPDDKVSIANWNYLSNRIPAGGPAGRGSRPDYNVPPVPPYVPTITINYCCKLHPKMLGQIKVKAIPTT